MKEAMKDMMGAMKAMKMAIAGAEEAMKPK